MFLYSNVCTCDCVVLCNVFMLHVKNMYGHFSVAVCGKSRRTAAFTYSPLFMSYVIKVVALQQNIS